MMEIYALKVVPPDWDHDMPIGLSEAGYQQWRSHIKAGMRVLLYHPGQGAIVGEGEVTGAIIQMTEWTPESKDELTRTTAHYAYLLPLRVIYERSVGTMVPLEVVREYLKDDHFPNTDEEWRIVDKDAYRILAGNFPG